jgi:hypothetical protein
VAGFVRQLLCILWFRDGGTEPRPYRPGHFFFSKRDLHVGMVHALSKATVRERGEVAGILAAGVSYSGYVEREVIVR